MAAEAIRITALRDGSLKERIPVSDLGELLRGPKPCVWIDLTEPSTQEVADVAAALGLHPLVVEDINESNERAKVEHIDDVIHLVLFALTRERGVHIKEIDFVLGHGFLLSVHPRSWDPLTAHQLRTGVAPVMKRGPDYLLWALVDAVVDDYFPIFDRMADEIDTLQDRVIANADPASLRQLFALKRELIKIRHVVAPSREIFNQLTSREYELISEPQVLYYRDIYDHLIRLTDDFDSFRELVSATVEVYLSTVNNNLSAIMKRLTGVTVVLAGIGAIGGIFGMSEAAPALAGQEGLGFWAITLAVIVVAGVAAAFLHRIDWL